MPLVMVVEDAVMFRDAIAACLHNAGYETVTASDGQEALRIVRERIPDLLLLDIAMPIMDGIEMLGVMRARSELCQVPVILLTGHSDRDRIVQAAKLGVREYLLKTRLSLKDLLTRVDKYVPIPKGVSSVASHAVVGAVSSTSQESAIRVKISNAEAAQPVEHSQAVEPDLHGIPNIRRQPARRSQPADVPAVNSPATASRSTERASTGQLPRLLTKEVCTQRIANCLQTKALAGLATQVIGLAASPRGDLVELAKLIMRDPVLSARVIQVANSAAYTSNRGPAQNVQEAVRRLGFSTVRNITVALGVLDVMPESAIEGFNPVRHWQHALAVAMLCEHLTQDDRNIAAGSVYLMGLCHDLGEVLFVRHFANEYRQVLKIHAQGDLALAQIETAMLGITRAELVAMLLAGIGLPDDIHEAISLFHSQTPITHHKSKKLVGILTLAETYANGQLLATGPESIVRGVSCTECRASVGQENPRILNGSELRSEIFILTEMLFRRRPDQISVTTLLYKKLAASVLLVRAPGLSSFDPVQAALESLASVTVASALPPDLAAWNAMVVLAPSSGLKGFTLEDIERPLAPGNKDEFPLLWLVGHDHASLDRGLMRQPTQWPVTLAQLAAFVESIPTNTPIAASA